MSWVAHEKQFKKLLGFWLVDWLILFSWVCFLVLFVWFFGGVLLFVLGFFGFVFSPTSRNTYHHVYRTIVLF